MINALAVFIGGGLGSLARYGISIWIRSMGIEQLPVATLLSNLLSTLVLGLIVTRMAAINQPWWYLLLAVGFCGGFSTFSTFSHETFLLMRSGQWMWSILNVLISVGLCIFLLFVISRSAE